MRGLFARSRRPIVVLVATLAVLVVLVPGASAVKRSTARLQLTPGKRAFGSLPVGKASAPFTFTVTNNGPATSGPVSFTVTGAGTNAENFVAASGATNGCVSGSTTLAAGASCSIDATFRPATVGKKSATLTVTAGVGEGAPSASLTGTATPGAHLTISPADNDFGQATVGDSSATATFTVTNTGAVTSGTIHDAIVGGDNTEFTIPYQTNSCDLVTLAPGGSCTIGVYFSPTSSGAKAAQVQAWANDFEGAPVATLEGQGQDVPPACTVGPNSGCITLTSVVLHLVSTSSPPPPNDPTYGTKTYTLSGTMSFGPTCADGSAGCDYSSWAVTGSGTFQVDDGGTNLAVGTWTTQFYPLTLGPFADASLNASTCHDAAIRQIFTRFAFTTDSSSWLADYVEIRTDTTASGPYKNMVYMNNVEGDGSYHTSDVSGVSITC